MMNRRGIIKIANWLGGLIFLLALAGCDSGSTPQDNFVAFNLTSISSVLAGSAQPADGTQNVALNTPISLQFSAPMSPNSLFQNNSFRVYANNNPSIDTPVVVQWNSNYTQFIASPVTETGTASAWEPSTTYWVVGSGWKDGSNNLVDGYKWSFSTTGNSQTLSAFVPTTVYPTSQFLCNNSEMAVQFSEVIQAPPNMDYSEGACQSAWNQSISVTRVYSLTTGQALTDVPVVVCLYCPLPSQQCNTLYLVPTGEVPLQLGDEITITVKPSASLIGSSMETVPQAKSFARTVSSYGLCSSIPNYSN